MYSSHVTDNEVEDYLSRGTDIVLNEWSTKFEWLQGACNCFHEYKNQVLSPGTRARDAEVKTEFGKNFPLMPAVNQETDEEEVIPEVPLMVGDEVNPGPTVHCRSMSKEALFRQMRSSEQRMCFFLLIIHSVISATKQP